MVVFAHRAPYCKVSFRLHQPLRHQLENPSVIDNFKCWNVSNIVLLVSRRLNKLIKFLKYGANMCSIQCLIFFFSFSGDDPHTSHFYIGFWILAGMFGFLSLQKLLGEDERENNYVKKEKLAKEKVNTYFVEQNNN